MVREVPAAGATRHHRRVDAARLRRRQEQGPGQHRQEPGGGPQPARLVRREAEGDQAAGGELCPGLESGVLLYSGCCFRLGALLTERDQLCQRLYRLPDVLNWLVSLSQVKDFLFLISFIF